MTKTHDKHTETHACDLIRRQAALDALEKIDCSDGVGISSLKCDAVDDAVTAIKALPSAQQWIPVAEGLPGIHEYVLLTCERNGNLVADFGCLSPYIDGDTSWWIAAHDSKEGWRVCAWMPLPEPARLGD